MAKTYSFECEIVIPRPREEVFNFFQKAENLQKLTPEFLDFEILTPTPIVMQEGTLIDYRLKLWGVPVNWKTRISEWLPMERFQDVQLSGPYKVWIHTHSFSDSGEHTLMRDRIQYRPRGGILAPLLNRFFVAANIRKIFEYRTERILDIF
jgi:ligand-binding SRPBCC domain-containing protein